MLFCRSPVVELRPFFCNLLHTVYPYWMENSLYSFQVGKFCRSIVKIANQHVRMNVEICSFCWVRSHAALHTIDIWEVFNSLFKSVLRFFNGTDYIFPRCSAVVHAYFYCQQTCYCHVRRNYWRKKWIL